MSEAPIPKPRLALFSPFYYPERISTGKVNTLLANELVQQGWEIDVICSHPLYPDWKPIRSLVTLPSTTFHRGGLWIHYPSHPLLRRVALELWFALHAAVTTLRLPKDVTVALMVYPPSLFGPLVMKLLPRRVRRVALVHDLQSEYSQNGYHSGFKLLTWVINKVEKRCLSGADRCIFVSKDIARTAQRIFSLDERKVRVQYPFATLDGLAVATNVLQEVLPAGIQHVVYAGALGEKQNPRVLAAWMEKAAQAMPHAQFHIFSGGPIFESLRKSYAEQGLLQFHDLIAEEELAELYARSAVQVIPQAAGTENGSLPSKLPNLLAAGVQILCVCPDSSEVAELLRAARTGTIVPEWCEDKFLAGLQDALASAAATNRATRRANAEDVLALCRVGSLAKLVAG